MKVKQCKNNEKHWYSTHLLSCPWCKIATSTGEDPFPNLSPSHILKKRKNAFTKYKSILSIIFIACVLFVVSSIYPNLNNVSCFVEDCKTNFLPDSTQTLLEAKDIQFSYPNQNSQINPIIDCETESPLYSPQYSSENKSMQASYNVCTESEYLQKNNTNSIGIDFVLIPPGKFYMGSQHFEIGRYDNEGPIHQVILNNPFLMSKYEITQKQWLIVMGDNPSIVKGLNKPVTHISWNDAQKFIAKLNEMENTDKYRLPSEAEWEYACRAGTTTKYYFGDSANNLKNYAWYSINSNEKIHAVGQKEPNQWGLYDMYGNVVEWTQDEWHTNYTNAPMDGSTWEKDGSSERVVRGGGCNYLARYCRSAFRTFDYADNADNRRGLRLVMELKIE